MASNGTVAQWLERRSYKAVAEGSIPSSPTYIILFIIFLTIQDMTILASHVQMNVGINVALYFE